MAQWAKVPAAKPDNLSLIPQDPYGKRRKPTSQGCPDLHVHAMTHVHTQIKV